LSHPLNLIASLPCWQLPMQKLFYLIYISRKVKETLVVVWSIQPLSFFQFLNSDLLYLFQGRLLSLKNSSFAFLFLCSSVTLKNSLTGSPYTAVSNGIKQMEERKKSLLQYTLFLKQWVPKEDGNELWKCSYEFESPVSQPKLALTY